MSEKTKIEWADATWNPWTGCTKVSPGCARCYAEALANRFPATFGGWGNGAARRETKNWSGPTGWNRRAESTGTHLRVFPSMCDWLDEEVPIEWLARFLQLVHDTPSLDWLLLTKRPENWAGRTTAVVRLWSSKSAEAEFPFRGEAGGLALWLGRWRDGCPPPNVWVGASVEDQERADERIPQLLAIPARIRWLSVEPMLGPVELQYATFNGADSLQRLEGIHWGVFGGESGPGARPCNVDWIRGGLRQCKLAGVPAFVKQVGAKPTTTKAFPCQPVPDDFRAFSHPKGGDPSEWPEDLRVREFPK